MSFKQWSFNFFVTVVLLNILIAVLVARHNILMNYDFQISIFGLMATFFLFAGIILGIISYVKKEEDDYKKKLGLFGNLGMFVLGFTITLF